MTELNEKIIPIQYRNWLHGQPPKRIKLEIDGWAGENTWKTAQPWHCKPYADSATYGLELIYTWQTTCVVSCDEKGHCTFDGDFTTEKPKYLGKEWNPFACFAPFHFGYVSMVDIKTVIGYNLMVMPHPRFYADKDGSIPCAVPGQLEMDWWPEIFFIVFKAPLPGCKLVFKHGDPIAQFMVVPRNIKYDITLMDDATSTLRAQRQENLEKNWNHLCTRVFYCEDDDEYFDNKYKILSGIARKDGNEAADKIMDKPKLIPHWNQNPQVVDSRPDDKQVPHHAPWTEEQITELETKKKLREEKKKQKLKEKVKEKVKAKVRPEDFENYTNEDIESLFDPALVADIDNVLQKDDVTEAELDRLVTAFKMQKRKKRQERSHKLKTLADPKKAFIDKTNYVLGYKVEKLL